MQHAPSNSLPSLLPAAHTEWESKRELQWSNAGIAGQFREGLVK